jgi:DNA-binding CsgD family transcriptional regulator
MAIAEILPDAADLESAPPLQLARPRELHGRATEGVAAAYASLGIDDRPSPSGRPPAVVLDEAIAAVIGAMTEPRMRSQAYLVRSATHLNELQGLRLELAELRTQRLLERQTAVRVALSRLRNVSDSARMLDLVPAELCRCDFRRAWMSRLDGSAWELAACHAVADGHLGAVLLARCDGPHDLTPGSHEAETIRRRTTALVADGADGRVDPTVAAVFAPGSYVVAPILVDSRVIGLLHADAGRAMTEEDRQTLGLFAEAVGHVIQRVVLLERFEVLRRGVRKMTHSIGDMVDDTCWAAVDMCASAPQEGEVVPRAAAPVNRGRESRLASLLTARELETNGGIAAQLVISEGTVKSHVKHILRKLHASNRAQAVSRYLRIVHASA